MYFICKYILPSASLSYFLKSGSVREICVLTADVCREQADDTRLILPHESRLPDVVLSLRHGVSTAFLNNFTSTSMDVHLLLSYNRYLFSLLVAGLLCDSSDAAGSQGESLNQNTGALYVFIVYVFIQYVFMFVCPRLFGHTSHELE